MSKDAKLHAHRLLSYPGVTLRHLEIFAKMMSGSTTAEVAETLGVSQPAVSVSIRQLEETLGLVLFERSGRRLSPTDTAVLLNEDVSSVMLALRGFSRRAADLSQGVTGRLRIVSTPPLGYSHAPEALARLYEHFPALSASYDVRRISEVYTAVQTGEADIGLAVFDGNRDTALQITPIHKTRMVALVPSDSDLASAHLVAPEDLKARPYIGLENDSIFGQVIRSSFRARAVAYDPRIEVRFCATAAALVEQGIGVAMVDPYSASSYSFPNVVRLPFAPAIEVSACVVTRRGIPHSSQLRTFTTLLKDVLHQKELSLPL
ncbi:HTH-type transcriptional regulator CynR [Aquimixticola soesokkakensis]|uniref:HTH-type transcriptional regulator CynR n=1 Tax=Aquimixticola soesokkakensis TaxID=1519096 RepID=A0A1Y5RZJ9_9RHOB|nr:LysR family transcriptional regulator [Aquimixticola soesokkakensis]SLN26587.1 HTH-type transcriptional regulator CynR [Aquimixticola soesokkakensis]